MAKRPRGYGSDPVIDDESNKREGEDYAKRDAVGNQSGTDYDAREDRDDTADTRTEDNDQKRAGQTTPDDGEAYIVVEEGTIINGMYYPDALAKAGEEMVVYMSEADAQELAKNGVALKKKEDGSDVLPPEEDTNEGVDEETSDTAAEQHGGPFNAPHD